MQDLTDSKPTSETVTAAEVYELGRRIGTQEERTAIIALLSGAALDRPDLDDFIYEIRAVLKTGAHRRPKP
jgi:hypothetical protein